MCITYCKYIRGTGCAYSQVKEQIFIDIGTV